MAKKKVRNNQEQPQVENALKPHNRQDPKPSNVVGNSENEASLEKLECLKSLNGMLLKEAVERRQQLESLAQAKGTLESELTRANSEKAGLATELAQLRERALRLEMERSVAFSFVGQEGQAVEKEMEELKKVKVEIEKKMESLEKELGEVLKVKCGMEKVKGENESEIVALNEKINDLVNEISKERSLSERATRDRDEMRVKLDSQMEYLKDLRQKLIETEEREKKMGKKIEELLSKYKCLLEEKVEKETKIENNMREKDSIESRLVEANKVIQEMKVKIQGIVKEKEVIAEERDVEKMKGLELENAVSGLNKTLLSLRLEEEKLHGRLAEFEKKFTEGEERLKEMGLEINSLIVEKKERGKQLERLAEEKGQVEKELSDALKRLGEQKLEIGQLVNEKTELKESADAKESIIVELQKEGKELRDVIKELENSCKGEMEKIKNLDSVIGRYKGELKRVTVERDEAKKGLAEEKQKALELKEKSEELERTVGKNLELSEELERTVGKNLELVKELEAKNVNIIAEKGVLESQCQKLKKEVSSVEDALTEAQKQLDGLRSRVESADTDSDRFLNMLKSTARLVCSNDEKNVAAADAAGDPYVAELESIKNAFKNKERKVDGMKKQIVSLQNSVVEARKKKSFLAFVSSATSVIVALSLAYIVAGH